MNDTTLVWPTTPLQQGFVALADTGRDHAYTGQAVLRITGDVVPAALHRAVTELLDAVPQLHAGFVMDADVDPVQFVEPGTPARYRTVVTDAVDFEPAVATARRVDAAKPFDLADPPLVRWTHVSTDGRSALVVTAHHAVLDAWSMPLLAGAIARGVAGEPARADGVYPRHLSWLATQDADAATGFWSSHLTCVGERAELPGGPRGRLRSHVEVDPAFLRAAGLTPADWARTAWGLALDVMTGGQVTPFAVPVSGRSPEVAGAATGIGLFTDSVLVADPADPATTLRENALAGAGRWRNSLPHHHVGMRGILRVLQTGELATSLLSVENPTVENSWTAAGATFTLESVEDDTHYPLALTVRPDGANWGLELDHRTDADFARRTLETFTAFLTAPADTPVAQVRPVPAETLRVFGTGPRSGESVPELLTVRWQRLVREFAGRDLLVDAGPAGETSRQTGSDLDSAVTALRTRILAELPTGGSGVVGISVPRGRASVEAVLAVLTAGAAVLVLDPKLPDRRRTEVLANTGAVALVTADGVQALHSGARGAQVQVPAPDDVAAVVLTSGSTGTPKPVAVPHRALAHLAARQLEDLHPSQPVQVAHTASFHFDAQWDALLALFGGHTVHVLAEDLFLDPFALAQYVRENAIAYLDLTPTVWSALLGAGAFTELPAVCVVGGEAFGGPLWTRMRELAAASGSRVFNLYGPTEATVDAFAAEVRDAGEPVVGKPVGPTGALVLDRWLRPVPPGVDGELYLAGPQLAYGYLRQPGRTAERFVANPHPDVVPGDRLYRTGDLARWDERGRLVVHGRTDDQLSVNGLRIEPGEVEHVLVQHPGVSSAVVLAPEIGRTGKRLVAWVVSHASSSSSPEELRAWCRDRLPSHLVPRDVVIMHEFPLTSNGKLDRARLPLPGQAQTTAQSSDDPALVAVREAVSSVLVVPVGDQDDFFRLGGDSISAIQVTARLRAAGWSVRPSELLLARTPERIAGHAVPVGARDVDDTPLVTLTTAQRTELEAHVRSVLGVAVERVWPLTPTQLGIHVDSQRTRPDPYRTTALLRVSGNVSAARVENAVQGWFARHPALRTGIWQGSLAEPVAFVPEHLRIPFDVVETDDLDALQRAELDRPVDASGARLAGATWVPGTPGHLVVSLHHLIADGWSLPVLAEELRQELSGIEVSVVDEGFERYLRTLSTTDAERFWRSELTGAEATLLGAGQQADPTRIVRRGTTVDLGDGVRDRGTTVASLVQSAWAAVLAARTGRTDVCWALTSSGRGGDVPGIEGAVGMFVTTRPVRARVDGELLRTVADATARSEEHAALGLGRIERLADRPTALTDTLVVVENYPTPRRDPGGDIAVELVEGRDATTFPVTVTAYAGTELRLEVEVDPELLGETAAVAHELLAGCAAALRTLVAGAVPDLTGIVRRVDGPELPDRVVAPVTGAPARADRIAGVVADVLGVTAGPGDDFFTLGGDSISAVRLVGALRAAGVVVGIADVFAARTPAGLDALATDHLLVPRHDGSPLLTPALAWFRGLDATATALRGFQQLRVVDLPAGTTAVDVAAAADVVMARHEALRLVVGDPLRIADPAPAVVREGDLRSELARACAEIDHRTGDLVRWVVVDGGSAEPRLAIAAHHVAVDAVSWGLLLDELRTLLAGGELPAPASFTAWTHAQQAAVGHARVARTAEPTDDLVPVAGPLGRAGDAQQHEVRLDPGRSRRFLDLVARGWRPDALLAAALTAGRGDLLVELEGHGRPTHLPADDPRHGTSGEAVGWFTATWPVRIPGGADVRGAHRAVRSSAVVGADHGVLRYLDPQGPPSPEPQVLVNWLGREVPAGTNHTPWRTSVDAATLEEELGLHDALPVSHPLELNAWATDGSEGPVVVARWQVAAPVGAGDVLTRWRRALEELLDAGLGEPPTDVHDAVGLEPGELGELMELVPARAVWPLSPVQRGMVFHAGEATDHYTSYVELDLAGRLDPTRLRQALDATVAAHPQLAARIARVGTRPVLVTVDTEVPWTIVDATDVETHRTLETHRTTELATPYDLDGPLLRARLLRTGPDRHVLILGTHHVLLDGWSVPLLVDELLGRYAGTLDEPAEDLVRGPFARFVARQVGTGTAVERRRELLAPHPEALEPLLPELDDRPVEETARELPAGLVAAAARALGSTPAAVLTAAWAVVLGALSGRRVVSPGVVVSGRDSTTGNLLGMFIDTVPLVLDLGPERDPDRGPAQLVRDVAEQTARASSEPAVGLAALSTALGRAPWVDTLLVVENYPVSDLPVVDGLSVLEVSGRDGTHYAFALTAEENSLRLEHHPGLKVDADEVLSAVERVVEGFSRSVLVSPDLPQWERRATAPVGGGPVDTVRSAFAEIFGRDVTADENFFALGGDSIVAMTLVSALRTAGWVARPSAVFTAPTPELLAGALEPLEPLRPAVNAPTISLDQRGTDALAALLRNL